MRNRFAHFLVGFCLLPFSFAVAQSANASGEFDVSEEFKVCFGFSCKSSQWVRLSEGEWQEIENLFSQVPDARTERRRIKEAVARMEALVAQYSPTNEDIGRNWLFSNYRAAPRGGQMDCIDESLNTTTYLKIMESVGMIRYHQVQRRAYRTNFFSQHWAAEILDIATGQNYVVDSWFRDNGELPYLVKGESWYNF